MSRLHNLYVTSRHFLQSFAPKISVQRIFGARFFCENSTPRPSPETSAQTFGVLLDIDGVLVRGRNPIPGAKEALGLLQKSDVPTVFLTNGGLEMEKELAEHLSDRIGFEVREDQMILSHTPLKMFDWLHNKHVLVSGQGSAKEILQEYGFTKVSDVEDVRRAYPLLDMVDRERRYDFASLGYAPEEFPPIEAIVLLGEPVRWETNLQLVIDMLVTNGSPSSSVLSVPSHHIPVIVSNTDLIYMAEVSLPRFGHGAFLLSLENLYKKLTGQELVYSAFLGKPYLTSYQYAEYCLNQNSGGASGNLRTLYAVGDNLDTDIYGANLCHEYVKVFDDGSGNINTYEHHPNDSSSQLEQNTFKWLPGVRKVESILVQTGVSTQDNDNQPSTKEDARYLHRDIHFHPHLRRANHVVENIAQAVELILKQEQINSQ
ncbi:unnamed protein product [Pocillopora meandrina]|uniref:Cat eye syndrome critical region protein 5 n=1 Tax=Pocillopora meandrina TaxID=46732 RepID=A0AAU9X6V6_9CNID|nr:unnamed protein product [Pocillopora meandrina]